MRADAGSRRQAEWRPAGGAPSHAHRLDPAPPIARRAAAICGTCSWGMSLPSARAPRRLRPVFVKQLPVFAASIPRLHAPPPRQGRDPRAGWRSERACAATTAPAPADRSTTLLHQEWSMGFDVKILFLTLIAGLPRPEARTRRPRPRARMSAAGAAAECQKITRARVTPRRDMNRTPPRSRPQAPPQRRPSEASETRRRQW